MNIIYHEKQDGLLCAQHCLNNLLQGKYFTAVDLADIAHQLDTKYGESVSANMDDSGYFSFEVIVQALEPFNLKIYNFKDDLDEIKEERQDPSSAIGFICHYNNHWFCLRKLGSHWFNVDSMKSKPKLISKTYLSLYIAQLQEEKYHVFVISGEYPYCESNATLLLSPINEAQHLQSEQLEESKLFKKTTSDKELEEALRLSQKEYESGPSEDDLSLAIKASLEDYNKTSCQDGKRKNPEPKAEPVIPTDSEKEYIKKKRLEYYNKK